MDKFDLIDVLGQYGISKSDASDLKGKIAGSDLMNLIQFLTSKAPGKVTKANSILSKYGIKLGNEKSMDNYLKAKYESVIKGEALDETFGVMTPVNEGFSYAVEVTEQTRDQVLDWLDENQVEYQATSPMAYRIECVDREAAYRTGRAISGILGKPTVRDSVETEVTEMSKSSKKREREAREKMATLKQRNPLAAMPVAGKGGFHKDGGDMRKVDKLGRGAKHKPRFDEEIDDVIEQNESVIEKETNLSEGVMGMKPVNPLFRLRELAGLPSIEEDDYEGMEIPEIPQSDPEGPLAAGPVADAPANMDVDGMGADPVEEPMADMDGGMDAPIDAPADLPVDPMGDEGVPGELGADPLEPVPGADPMGIAPMTPTQSDAMAQIEDALNSIQSGLADSRLSEYKSLIQKLQDLTNQAQMMGRDYLGERFERRKK